MSDILEHAIIHYLWKGNDDTVNVIIKYNHSKGNYTAKVTVKDDPEMYSLNLTPYEMGVLINQAEWRGESWRSK